MRRLVSACCCCCCRWRPSHRERREKREEREREIESTKWERKREGGLKREVL
jgi:hypothetical protein